VLELRVFDVHITRASRVTNLNFLPLSVAEMMMMMNE